MQCGFAFREPYLCIMSSGVSEAKGVSSLLPSSSKYHGLSGECGVIDRGITWTLRQAHWHWHWHVTGAGSLSLR